MHRLLISSFAALLLAVPGLADTPALLELEPVNASTIREWILHLESMPCGVAYADSDPDFWQIVRLGMEHVPTILELVADDTSTEMHVCLFDGRYAVGDVAVMAISRIVTGAPIAEFAAGDDQDRFKTIGFGVYWQFVRESRSNRDEVKEFLEQWFESNKDRIEWVRRSESPAGGFYRVKDDTRP